jgi:hypothetical protein
MKIVRKSFWGLVVVCFTAAWVVGAGEEKAKQPLSAADLLPENVLAALIVPDLAKARTEVAAGRLGKMYAEPEIQEFLKGPLAYLQQRYEETRKANPLLGALPDVAGWDAALSGEIAFALLPPPQEGMPPGAVVSVSVDKAETLAKLLGLFPPFAQQPPPEGQALLLVGTPEGPALLRQGARLTIGYPSAAINAVAERFQAGKAAAPGSFAGNVAYQKTRMKMGKSSLVFVCVDMPKMFDCLLPVLPPTGLSAKTIKEAAGALGLKQTGLAAFGVGVSDGELLTESFLPLTNFNEGIWTLCGDAAPLSREALKIVPKDAPYFHAGKFAPAALMPLIRRTLESMGAEGTQALSALQMGLGLFAAAAGADLEKDVLASFDSEYLIAYTAYDTGMPLSWDTGLVLSWKLKDKKKLEDLAVRLCVQAEGLVQISPSPLKLRIKSAEYKGQTVRWVGTLGAGLGFNSFAFVEDRMLLATSLNALKRSIDQLSAPENIAASPDFQATVARLTGKPFDLNQLPASITFSTDETGSGMGAFVGTNLYLLGLTGLVGVLAEAPGGENPAAAEGKFFDGPDTAFLKTALGLANETDFALWPDSAFFKKYRRHGGALVQKLPDGLYVRGDFPPPFPGRSGAGGVDLMTGAAVASVVAAIAIPNLLRSRMAANETAAIGACKTFCTAQITFRRTDFDGDGVLEYAQTLQAYTAEDIAAARKELKLEAVELDEKGRAEAEKLIAQLGVDKYETRGAAAEKLAEMSSGVLPLLKAELKKNKDPEVQTRCENLIRRLSPRDPTLGAGGKCSLYDEVQEIGNPTYIDLAFARAEFHPCNRNPVPKQGYLFKVLTGCKKRGSFIENGNMTLGFALVAFPAKYDDGGRNTFVVDTTGTIYQKDLGPETKKIVSEMTDFPDLEEDDWFDVDDF